MKRLVLSLLMVKAKGMRKNTKQNVQLKRGMKQWCDC